MEWEFYNSKATLLYIWANKDDMKKNRKSAACTPGYDQSAGKMIGSALARHTGQEESEKIRHLYQGLAVRLAKGNASLFLNRTPAFPTPEIDGDE